MRKYGILLILCLMVFCLTGCGGDDSSVKPTATPTPQFGKDLEGFGAKTTDTNPPEETVQPRPTPIEQVPVFNDNQPVEVGGYITFGHYEQDNNPDNGPEPIEWLVLDVKGGKALLLSKYGLDVQPYNNEYEDTTWEKSTLRAWLDKEFRGTAFSEAEQSVIMYTRLDNSTKHEDNHYETSGGIDTWDKVFLLSSHEVYDLYLPTERSRRSVPTAYALANDACVSGQVGGINPCVWWLRSPGQYQDCAADVYTYNQSGTNYYSPVSFDHNCIRPACWINLDAGNILIPSVEQEDKNYLAESSKEYFESVYDLTPDTFDIVEKVLNHNDNYHETEEVDGKWYFKFVEEGKCVRNKEVYILCDAFTKSGYLNTMNNTRLLLGQQTISKFVSKALNSGTQSILIFSSREDTDPSHTGLVCWNISKFVIEGSYKTGTLSFNVEKISEIMINYFLSETEQHTRSAKTLHEYTHGALGHGLYTVEIKPEFTVQVVCPGKNLNYLSTSVVRGSGTVPAELNISDFMSIWGASEDLLESVVTLRPNVKVLLDVYAVADKIEKGRHKQFLGKTHQLSTQGLKALKETIVSPFALQDPEEFFELDIGLNDVIAEEPPFPEIEFTVSFK